MSDLISRQDAIDAVKRFLKDDDDWFQEAAASMIRMLPSADRPTGEWVKSDILPNGWHCSHCDSPVMTDDIEEMLFCPHCGSEMGGDSDG